MHLLYFSFAAFLAVSSGEPFWWPPARYLTQMLYFWLLFVLFHTLFHAFAPLLAASGEPFWWPPARYFTQMLYFWIFGVVFHTLLHAFAPLLAFPGGLPKAIWLHVLYGKLICHMPPTRYYTHLLHFFDYRARENDYTPRSRPTPPCFGHFYYYIQLTL